MFEKFKVLIGRFIADRSGVTAIEYGVIAVAIVLAILAAVALLGTDISNAFNNLSAGISSP